ncbi:MAG: hypothetical protein ACYTGQ_19640 [Planctomycetota bacterium]|jgi:hypothetical protein
MTHTRRTLLIGTLVAVLLLSGLAVGSNRAFKYTIQISEQNANVDHWLSLPYRMDYTTANDLCAASPEASLISRFDAATMSRVDWTCPFGNNFPLSPGEGVIIRTQAASSPVFAGSHEPGMLVPPGGFVRAGVDHLIALPYHSTAERAAHLCLEVPNATLISRFDVETRQRVDWTCPYGTNFSLRYGEALAIRVDAPNEGFVPQHY